MMKVLNLMWGVSLGGVGKCFLTYASLGEIEPKLEIHSVCINLNNESSDLRPFEAMHVRIINIRNRGDFSWLAECRNIISQMTPDVIFTHGFNGPVVVQALCLWQGLNIPMVCSYHSEYHPPSSNRRFIAPLLNFATHGLYKRKAVGIVTVAHVNKDFLVRCGVDGKKIVVVHNGISCTPQLCGRLVVSELFPGSCEDAVTVGIASRLDAIKGLEYLLEAVAVVRHVGVRIRLILLGEGPLRASLQVLAKTLGIEDTVYFAGFQSNIPDWLGVLDIFALPSLSEAHSISLLEAMRAGKAIVATRVGGNSESVRDGQDALLVPPADAQALAAALTRLAGDADLRIRLGKAARRRFEGEFTEEIMKRRLADWLLSFAPTIQSP